MTVFLGYDQAELDRQYDQRAWAANAADVIRRYADDSDAAGRPPRCTADPCLWRICG
jgi:hypothetical protein